MKSIGKKLVDLIPFKDRWPSTMIVACSPIAGCKKIFLEEVVLNERQEWRQFKGVVFTTTPHSHFVHISVLPNRLSDFHSVGQGVDVVSRNRHLHTGAVDSTLRVFPRTLETTVASVVNSILPEHGVEEGFKGRRHPYPSVPDSAIRNRLLYSAPPVV